MKSHAFNPWALEVEAFAKQAASLAGSWPLAELARLSASAFLHPSEASVEVVWSATGELRARQGAAAQTCLHVAAQTQLVMQCQRCLGAVEIPLSVQRSFVFVHGETAAAELDATCEDDVLAMTKSLHLQSLVEDELLMALPLVPRHDVCPQPLQFVSEELADEGAASPFAALAAFKRGGLPS